ncbi:MAG: uridine diphosphate-N-acetylglucosamine-binding protein YvcK [Actinomycetota bacterium]|nr:uridine diphosphate-N-acetylglucosamine-binding protein YvcK [Actinomycetota bacterium]
MSRPAAQPPSDGPRVVALGGGHGLAASLQALRQVTPHLTAVVTVADDGGSSGRLRDELGVLPPGDLRMAIAALAGSDEWGQTWAALLQHRFAGDGPLAGHAVGNLVLAGLTGSTGNAIRALDLTAQLVGAVGRVLPMSCVPLEIVAEVIGADPRNPMSFSEVVGQVAVATTLGAVAAVSLRPADPAACAESVEAVRRADWVVLGPGSWFTSVLPHLLVPDLRAALVETSARTLVCLNLAEQAGETAGFSPEAHLEVLAAHAPELAVDVVLADEQAVVDPRGLMAVVRAAGARLVLAPVARGDGTPRHDPDRLAEALSLVLGEHPPAGRGTTEAQAWR